METMDAGVVNAKIGALRETWKKLNDVNRGRAVHEIHEAGTSFRALAKELGCSESLLRRLDRAAQAPVAHRVLASHGKISTRKMAQSAADAEKLRAAQQEQIIEKKRTEDAQQGARAICNWIEEHQHWPVHGENIIDEARRIIAFAEADGTLPKFPAPEGTPLDRIIEHAVPKPVRGDTDPLEVGSIAWYSEWLAQWAFYAFPDAEVRDRALRLALEHEIRRMPDPKAQGRK